MVFEVSSVGTKQTTDLIFDYYFLDEIQDISRVGCRFCLIGMLLLNTNGWCCSDWRGVAAVPVYKSWHLSLCNNNNYLQHQSRPDSRPACHPAPLTGTGDWTHWLRAFKLEYLGGSHGLILIWLAEDHEICCHTCCSPGNSSALLGRVSWLWFS